MAPVRKILVVDPDPETVRTLAPALRQRGYQVHAARDGSRALQVAVLRFPDLILIDEAAPLLDAATFIRILRANPRTERIPVVRLGAPSVPGRDEPGLALAKPIDLETALGRIDQVLRRVEAARVAAESREVEGSLAQIPLPDLLQILSVNRRSGRLVVERGDVKAEVALVDGRVVDATLGPISGEKALYRLLGGREGKFAFLPGAVGAPERIDRMVEALVLEGVRQSDELAELLPALPAPQDLVELAVDPSEIPAGLHPVTEEVVEQLATPRPFREVIDRCHASDLEAARAVAALLERGYARRRQALAQPPAPALLSAPELHALRARLVRGRASGPQTVGKVVLAGGDAAARQAARTRLAGLPGFTALGPEGPFGTVGRLALGEGVLVDLVTLPGEPELRPLWRPFAAGALGALLLGPLGDAAELAAELVRGLRLPTVICAPAEGAGAADVAGAVQGGPDAAGALELLLGGPARSQARAG